MLLLNAHIHRERERERERGSLNGAASSLLPILTVQGPVPNKPRASKNSDNPPPNYTIFLIDVKITTKG